MKIQSIVYAIAASQSILSPAAAGSVRGSISKQDEEPHGNDQVVKNNNDTEQQRDLRDEDDPFRLFSQGVEPDFRTREGDRDRSRPLFEPGGGEYNGDVDRDNRIIGGQVASSNECLWCVSMQDNLGHFCGGSLVAPNMVLTAAHCLGGSYNCVAGRSNLNQNGGQSVRMKKELRHPRYNSARTDNDFALLILDKPMDMSKGVELVDINPDSSTPQVGDEVTVLGWGDTVQSDFVSKLSDKLMKVNVNMISNDQCGKASGSINGYSDNYFGQITSNMMCANVQGGGKDACQGDSGGPLITRKSGKPVQIGVVSWGIGCASASFPGVYARVSSQYDWIREEVCKNGVDVPDSFKCAGGGGNNGGGNGGGGVTAIQINEPVTGAKPDSGTFDITTGNGGSNGGGGNGGGGNGGGNGGGGNGGGGGNFNGNMIFSEDFTNGFGIFKDGGIDARHYDEAKFRKGVIRLQNQGENRADAFTKEGWDVSRYSTCQTSIDFMTIAFEKDDGDEFCVEYSSNGKNYNDAKCYNARQFNNKRWWEGERAEFSVKNIDEIWIRVRCRANNRKDDVLISHIELECSK